MIQFQPVCMCIASPHCTGMGRTALRLNMKPPRRAGAYIFMDGTIRKIFYANKYGRRVKEQTTAIGYLCMMSPMIKW